MGTLDLALTEAGVGDQCGVTKRSNNREASLSILISSLTLTQSRYIFPISVACLGYSTTPCDSCAQKRSLNP